MSIAAAMDHAAVSAALRRLSRVLGLALTAACLGFVAWRLASLAPQIRELAEWPDVIMRAGVATAVYATGSVALAVAWWLLLRTLTSPRITLRSAARGHMRAQLAKYLPGNVFHFAARHVHAQRDGLGHVQVASAAMAESVLLVLVAAMLSATIPSSALPDALLWLDAWRWPMVAVLLLGLLVGVWLVRRGGGGAKRRSGSMGSDLSGLVAAASCYLVFFLVAASAFRIVLEANALPSILLIGSVAFCWLGGFLVVGAPGGLGVREALFLALLGPLIGDPQAMLAALTFRGVTILGDVVVTAGGMFIGPGRLARNGNSPPQGG